MKIGVVGCGAIGSEIAVAVLKKEISGYCLTGLYDADEKQVARLISRLETSTAFKELDDLIEASDLVFEATQKSFMPVVVEKALRV